MFLLLTSCLDTVDHYVLSGFSSVHNTKKKKKKSVTDDDTRLIVQLSLVEEMTVFVRRKEKAPPIRIVPAEN